jgi:hypothetical protein
VIVSLCQLVEGSRRNFTGAAIFNGRGGIARWRRQ